MKVKVIGKSHLEGSSKKSGKPYDFIQANYNGRARGVEGLAALTLSLDPKDYLFADVVVGAEYNAELDNRSYIQKLLPVTKA